MKKNYLKLILILTIITSCSSENEFNEIDMSSSSDQDLILNCDNDLKYGILKDYTFVKKSDNKQSHTSNPDEIGGGININTLGNTQNYIKVKLRPELTINWKEGSILAFQVWNDILQKYGLRFVCEDYITPSFSALKPNNGFVKNLTVRRGVSNDNWVAATSVGQNGLDFSTSIIENTNHPNYGNFSIEEVKIAMVHEIGHVLGFHHTNNPYSFIPANISGTNKSDPNSIMNSTIDLSRNFIFSDKDLYSIEKVFNRVEVLNDTDFLYLFTGRIEYEDSNYDDGIISKKLSGDKTNFTFELYDRDNLGRKKNLLYTRTFYRNGNINKLDLTNFEKGFYLGYIDGRGFRIPINLNQSRRSGGFGVNFCNEGRRSGGSGSSGRVSLSR